MQLVGATVGGEPGIHGLPLVVGKKNSDEKNNERFRIKCSKPNEHGNSPTAVAQTASIG